MRFKKIMKQLKSLEQKNKYHIGFCLEVSSNFYHKRIPLLFKEKQEWKNNIYSIIENTFKIIDGQYLETSEFKIKAFRLYKLPNDFEIGEYIQGCGTLTCEEEELKAKNIENTLVEYKYAAEFEIDAERLLKNKINF